MTEHKPHPHAELMQQWCDDHKVIPPLHEWEYRSRAQASPDFWMQKRGSTPSWSVDVEYRRVIKPTPHPSAEQIMQWAEDNQTALPAHEWEYRHDGSVAWHRLSNGWTPAWHMSHIHFRRVQK